jgi:CheY-like chemotaxis protein
VDDKPIVLIVDDEPFNVAVLEQELEDLGYATISAENGQEALDTVAAESPDLVLLDIMMPVLDGFAVLARLKDDPATCDIPVIIISALSDIRNVVKGIELGAEDYLPKPFDSVLLEARVGACIEKKRLRDLERAYLEDVERLTQAAMAVESNAFDPASLEPVAGRSDALGGLARVFQRMAGEVRAREQRLMQQLQQALLDTNERATTENDSLAMYIPMDRRVAMSRGETLSRDVYGACLFVDVSGFTRLSETLAAELGPKRGAEELIRHLNAVFGALIDEAHRMRGSVVSFSGDAMTCWFEGDNGRRATRSALAMQGAMSRFEEVVTPAGTTVRLAIKAAVAAGKASRHVVGDPAIQVFDVLAGQPLVEVALAEQVAKKGQVVAPRSLVEQSGTGLTAAAWRTDLESGRQFAIVTGVMGEDAVEPWPALAPDAVSERESSAWVLPAVAEKVTTGSGEFLAELRPVAALFLGFGGIDFDRDARAGERLDAYVRWVQGVVDRYGGTLLQVTVGDKGSYVYAVFGAPVLHEDDPLRAVGAALDLLHPPAEHRAISEIRIGVAYGEMRAGAYGGAAQRTYGVQGSRANLAAYLMQHAAGGILCDEAIHRLTRGRVSYEALSPIPGKKGGDPIPVFRPTVSSLQSAIASRLDGLPASAQLTLKIGSVIGERFPIALLREVHPVESAREGIEADLEVAEAAGFLVRIDGAPEPDFAFVDAMTHDQIYTLLLHAQRRGVHQAIAEWHEARITENAPAPDALLAQHWAAAGNAEKSSHYLERAGAHALERGESEAATRYFRAALSTGT